MTRMMKHSRQTLLAVNSEEVDERLEAAKNLARFEVEKAVFALTERSELIPKRRFDHKLFQSRCNQS